MTTTTEWNEIVQRGNPDEIAAILTGWGHVRMPGEDAVVFINRVAQPYGGLTQMPPGPVGEPPLPGGETPGGRPPLTGGGANMPPQQGWPVGSPNYMERYGRWPAYGTAAGLYGKDYLAPFQQYQVAQGQELSPLFDIYGQMGSPGGAPGMFGEWAGQYAGKPRAMYGLAEGLMGQLMGMAPDARAQTEITAEGGQLAQLLQMALRQSVGKNTANWMAGRIPQEQEAWLAQYPGQGQTEMPFLDYFKQKYNLGQYF